MSFAPFGRSNNLQFRVTLAALRQWQAVLVTPMPGSLEGGNERLVAAGVQRFRNLMLFAPAPFEPRRLNGVADPQIYLRTSPYNRDFVNPSPNVGVAWNPGKPGGWLGTLLGQAVYGANFGVNYYDEGLISFQTSAGNGPGLRQTLALPPFTPGSLNLQTPLPPFTATPTEFAFPIPMSGFTFNRGHATFDPDIKTPYVYNWTLRYQGELWRDAALQISYVGNRGRNLWRSYNLNETNIIENGFLDEFRKAQANLYANIAAGRGTTFAYFGAGTGTNPLPIYLAHLSSP